MPRAQSQPEPAPPDRLTAVLEEIDSARRGSTWTPQEETITDPPRRLRERIVPRRRSPHPPGPGRHHAGEGSDGAVRPHTPLVRPPVSLRDSQVAPSRLALVGLLTLLLVAGLIFGGRVLLARATAAPHPVDPHPSTASGSALTTGGPEPSRQATAAAAATTTTATPTPTVLVVQVVGQVEDPGVVELKTDARVQDAVQAAGGARDTADLTRINMARKVVDGEQIYVPKPGEEVTPPPVAPSAQASTAAGEQTEVVDLNTASQQQLEQLPGIGPVIAGRIVDWRTQHGQFTSVAELAEVSGIGDKTLQQLEPHVRV